MAVGMALAERRLAHMFGDDIINHYTYVLAGDGCLMEGVSYEACNLAGLWGLNKLIMLYDCNEITLDGRRDAADGEDVKMRFAACGWNVIDVKDANTPEPIMSAIDHAKKSDKPTLIICRTEIGYGTKTMGTERAHGVVLTRDECVALRKSFGMGEGFFTVDRDVEDYYAQRVRDKSGSSSEWTDKLGAMKRSCPSQYREILKFIVQPTEDYFTDATGKPMALRDAGHSMLNQIYRQNPRLWGANADISSTTKAFVREGGIFAAGNPGGSDIACGVREHGMAAIVNGLALHGFHAYCSTFLVFSDYARPAMRLSALMGLPVHYIFSHDGFGNPPDGPTHQGAESITALRIIPNMHVWRPCDDIETAAVYKYVYKNMHPTCTILSRGGGKTPIISDMSPTDRMLAVERGGYVLATSVHAPRVTLLATGVDVELALEAKRTLDENGIGSILVSMPSTGIFDAQTEAYRLGVLRPDLPIVAVEMGTALELTKYVCANGRVLNFDTFGHSGTEAELREKFGFTAQNIITLVKELL